MSIRERLPNRRPSITFDFEHNGLRYRATASYFADGRPAEVFVNNHKYASEVDMFVRDAAILTSLALQYGAPIEVLRDAVERNGAGQPTSPISMALDMIAKG